MGVVKIPVDNDDDDRYEKMITAIKIKLCHCYSISTSDARFCRFHAQKSKLDCTRNNFFCHQLYLKHQ